MLWGFCHTIWHHAISKESTNIFLERETASLKGYSFSCLPRSSPEDIGGLPYMKFTFGTLPLPLSAKYILFVRKLAAFFTSSPLLCGCHIWKPHWTMIGAWTDRRRGYYSRQQIASIGARVGLWADHAIKNEGEPFLQCNP